MLLQPSDDLYSAVTVHSMKKAFRENPKMQALTYKKGFICNYNTKEILEYNPKTNPPFFAIKFPRQIFFDPGKHINYTGPYKSHEYVGDKLLLGHFEDRGFLVGTHGENISTHFNHPYGTKNPEINELQVQALFGMINTPVLELPKSFRKWLIRKLPYKWQKKLRYWWGERMFNWFYTFIRN